MDDYYSGLDLETFQVTADFRIDEIAAGKNLARRFQKLPGGVFELKLNEALIPPVSGTITASVKDYQGNISTVVRTFSLPAQ